MSGDENWLHRCNSYRNSNEAISLTIYLLILAIGLYLIGGIITPLFLSLIGSYLLNFLVEPLERRKWRHRSAVRLVFGGFLGVLLYAVFWLLPTLNSQLRNLVILGPKFVNYLQQHWLMLQPYLPSILKDGNGDFIWGYLTDYFGVLSNGLLNFSIDSLLGLGSLLSYMFLVPVLMYFTLRDRDQLLWWFAKFLPKQHGSLLFLWGRLKAILLSYLRGKFLEMLLMSGISISIFKLMGLNYAVLLGILVGGSVFVPYLGIVVVTVPVMVVALLQWGFGRKFGILASTHLLLNILDGQLLSPLLLAQALSLHPLAIILAVMIFGYWLGFWGVVLAVPMLAAAQLLLTCWPINTKVE